MNIRRSECSVVAFDGYIYVVGGKSNWGILDSVSYRKLSTTMVVPFQLFYFNQQVEWYNTNNNEWSFVTPMLKKRWASGVATLNGKLYACGGHDGIMFLNTVEEYYSDKQVLYIFLKCYYTW